MKTLSRLLALITLFTFALEPSLVRAQDVPPPPDQSPPPDQGDSSDDQGASFQTFYDQLGNQGTWIQTDNYGYVFQPTVSDPNWAPYSDGHWVYTDEGWTWVSDEPWGWATYHYGRWANIDGTGWVWIPGYRWAPAWVSWRYGGGYCGWAPLPPESFVGAEYGGGGVAVGVGFHFGGDVDVNFGIGAGCYNFLAVGDMGEPNYRGRYIDHSRNYTVINNTTNITNINVTNNYGTGAAGGFRGVSTGGPKLADINAHVRTPIQTVQLTAASRAGRSTMQGNSLAVYAPRVNPATIHQAKPSHVAATIAHPKINRGNSITRPLAVNAHLKPSAPSSEAIAAAREAQAHAPATSRIATENTRVKAPLQKPLTAMQPVSEVKHTSNPPATSSQAHPSATSSYSGETEKPATTYHPESAPAATYHPQTEEKPAPTYHPQTEEKPAPTYHPQTEEKPASTYHPPAEAQHEQAPASHPQPAAKPAPQASGDKNKGSSDDKNKEPQGH